MKPARFVWHVCKQTSDLLKIRPAGIRHALGNLSFCSAMFVFMHMWGACIHWVSLWLETITVAYLNSAALLDALGCPPSLQKAWWIHSMGLPFHTRTFFLQKNVFSKRAKVQWQDSLFGALLENIAWMSYFGDLKEWRCAYSGTVLEDVAIQSLAYIASLEINAFKHTNKQNAEIQAWKQEARSLVSWWKLSAHLGQNRQWWRLPLIVEPARLIQTAASDLISNQ